MIQWFSRILGGRVLKERDRPAFANFTQLLENVKSRMKLLIIYDDSNTFVARKIYRYLKKHSTISFLQIQNLCEFESSEFRFVKNNFDYCLVLSTTGERKENLEKRNALREQVLQDRNFFLILKDLDSAFFDFFNSSAFDLAKINDKIIKSAANCSEITIRNDLGTHVKITATPKFTWGNFDGLTQIKKNDIGFYELLFGEVATHSQDISGTVSFTGALLEEPGNLRDFSLIKEPIFFSLEKNWIKNISGKNTRICRLLEERFSQQEYASYVTEVGIGTHPNIKLEGQNRAYQERKAGAHLGVGGIKNSYHLDFIFEDCQIFFDDWKIFDKGFSFKEPMIA